MPAARCFHRMPAARCFHRMSAARCFHRMPTASCFHRMPAARCFQALLPLLLLSLVLQSTAHRSQSLTVTESQSVVGSGVWRQPLRSQEHQRSATGSDGKSLWQGHGNEQVGLQANIHGAHSLKENSKIYMLETGTRNTLSQPNNDIITSRDKLLQTTTHQPAQSWQIQDSNQEDLNHQFQDSNKEDLNHQFQDSNQEDLNHQFQDSNQEDLYNQFQDSNQEDLNHQELRSSSLGDYLPLTDWITWDTSTAKPEGCRLEDNDTRANCSHLYLTEVPSEGIPTTIHHFDLSYNKIRKLANLTFVNYTQLESLDISVNNISELQERAFYGLQQLKTLNLWDNKLSMSPSTFPDSVFRPLVRLEKLNISKNNANCRNVTALGLSYPDKAFSSLTNLRTLSMDGLFDPYFGLGFRNLSKLVNLSMVGYLYGCCHINSLPNHTFQYMPNIQRLDINNCYILGSLIGSGAFSYFNNLTFLDLTHNEYIDIQNLDSIFQGLSKIPSLKELRMNLIVNRFSIGICLDSYFIRNFPQHLQHFEAKENNIEGLDRRVLRTLSPSLISLDVSVNRFVFGTYLKDLSLLTNLKELKLNGGGFTYKLPQRYPFQMTVPATASNCSLYESVEEDKYEIFTLKLPPKLRSVEMKQAGLTYRLSSLVVHPENVLQSLNMTGNKFPTLAGPFIGLHSLATLDLSSSFVRYISETFFANLTSLTILCLNDNLLGDFFSKSKNPPVFLALTKLTKLDLSFNYISKLQVNVFAGLDKLQDLFLSKNSLSHFLVDISHMQNLRLVDLRLNRIVNLPALTQQHINFLLGQGLNVTLDLSSCPITCECDNFLFLSWMTRSRAFDPNFNHYYCEYHNNLSQEITDGYNSTIAFLRKKCASNTMLFLCVAGVTFVGFCVILCSVMYRFRWKLRYLYYAAHLFVKSKKNSGPRADFEYDAFISYDEADQHFVVNKLSRELEKRGLKLCIHGRDFRAGEYIASNIVRAVCSSRKTVVVLTRHLVSSYWCSYEIQMANMETMHSGRMVLVFLLMEDIPDSELSKELLYNIRNNTYIEYPESLPDATNMGRLWDKLTADIRD